MNLFFDMDNTLIGDRHQLRPLVRETLEQLHNDGHAIYVWSGVGIRWKEVHANQLDPWVIDCYHKPLDEVGQRSLSHHMPDLVIDDVAAIVEQFGGVVIRPYYLENPRDREMERVYRIVQDVVRTGVSEDSAFRAGLMGQRVPPNGARFK
jgi:hydroxymethylpyrimidine pyrophosphatase-like HAD family hydrolase